MEKQRAHGFTLIEIMVAIAVAAIILSLAVPNFSAFLRNSRLTTAANDLIAAIQAARGEAIKRQSRVVFCFSATPETAPDCDGSGEEGWIVFIDTNQDVAVTSGETVLLVHAALHEDISVRNVNGTGGYLSFLSSGFASPVAAAGDPISSFLLCDARGNVAASGGDISTARGIQVSVVGRPSVTRSVTAITGLGNCT